METFKAFLNTSIEIGQLHFTPLSIITGLFLVFLLGFATRILKQMLVRRVLPRAISQTTLSAV